MDGLPPLPIAEALILRTARLNLLPINQGHAPAMFDVLNDPALYEFVSSSPPTDVGALSRLYEFWENRRSPNGAELWLNWVLNLRAQDRLIGHFQVGVQPDHADMAWFLGLKWQHHGYATEAAEAVLAWLLQLVWKQAYSSDHIPQCGTG